MGGEERLREGCYSGIFSAAVPPSHGGEAEKIKILRETRISDLEGQFRVLVVLDAPTAGRSRSLDYQSLSTQQ